MLILYHYPLCPISRQIRIYLKEFNVDFTLKKENYWSGNVDFLAINPASTVPVLISEHDIPMVGYYPVIEYMNETYSDFFFMPKDPIDRLKTRQYISWFNDKFYREVVKILIDEKVIRPLTHQGEPRSIFIKTAKLNLARHLKFLNNILNRNSFIIGDAISCADIAAASAISVIDYFGEIKWSNWPLVKDWYSIIKSRPSFRSVLQDIIPGFSPPIHYVELDF